MRVLLTLIILSLVVNCKSSDQNGSTQNSAQMDQGIKGKVLWLEGNFMPGPGMNKEGEPVAKELYIYPLINTSEIKKTGHFYEVPDQEPVKIVESDKNGTFKVGLAPGSYSLFTMEEKGLYASLQDGEGNIHPVDVKEGEYTEVTFKVDYKAVY